MIQADRQIEEGDILVHMEQNIWLVAKYIDVDGECNLVLVEPDSLNIASMPVPRETPYHEIASDYELMHDFEYSEDLSTLYRNTRVIPRTEYRDSFKPWYNDRVCINDILVKDGKKYEIAILDSMHWGSQMILIVDPETGQPITKPAYRGITYAQMFGVEGLRDFKMLRDLGEDE